jgi:hypothetical protein
MNQSGLTPVNLTTLPHWLERRGRKNPYHRRRLLRPRRERPRRSAAEQRDELTPFQLIELHPVPASQGRIAGYRIASDQSAGSWGAKQ